jgi:hypothetical protein
MIIAGPTGKADQAQQGPAKFQNVSKDSLGSDRTSIIMDSGEIVSTLA